MATTISPVSAEIRNRLRENDVFFDHSRCQHLLNAANTAYTKLRTDEQAWQAYTDELAEWNSTLNDGLEAYR